MYKVEVYSRYENGKYFFSMFDDSEEFTANCGKDGYDHALENMEMLIMLCLRSAWSNNEKLELKEHVQDESDIEYELIKIRD